MKKELKAGDVLIDTKLDRVARSATQGIELINELFESGKNTGGESSGKE